jgi:hypothetical protein
MRCFCSRSFEVSFRIASLALLTAVACTLGCDAGSPQTSTSQGDSEAASSATSEEDVTSPTSDNNSTNQNAEQTEGKVLRHAVFFRFKDSSSSEQIQEVVDAFAALPEKISEIIDFQAGTNNSPEGLDDGFTHCFLLTFRDESGRAAYLPHPAHSGEFADTLRPHMEDVFVIDYWGSPADQEMDRELKHAVFFKFKDDADPEAVQKVEEAFAALPGKIDTIKAFEWGKNNSPEKHDDGFTHCFMVTFDTEEGRAAYLPHPDHLAFVEVLKPVLDKVRVLDFWEDDYQDSK